MIAAITMVNETSFARTRLTADLKSDADAAWASLMTRNDSPPHAITGIIWIVCHDRPTANTPTPAIPYDRCPRKIVVSQSVPDETNVATTLGTLRINCALAAAKASATRFRSPVHG